MTTGVLEFPLSTPPTQRRRRSERVQTMAEMTENESKKSEINLGSIIEHKKNEGIQLLCSVLEKFGFKWKPESSSSSSSVSSTQTEEGFVQTTTTKISSEGEIISKKSDVVTFSDAVAVRKPDFSSLKLKVDDSEQGGRPNQLWPVYALGGFMIAKWMWARWQEAKAKKPDPPSGDEEPST